ncbi:ribosome-binding protein 1-like isoform X3 [Bacillus rossius redtenbacheri]|uniref:ribosome-binding protein 1-like isoform X3 n=1 Tax=Bacillus rossius redtenbacheri TaxID=93214 RepID=UPI002FDDDD4C
MDIQTGIICLGVAGISAVAIFVIFVMFGMKEKTYDEAIAEQRKMPEENLLLTRAKEKSKEKKQKKAGKKVKEKPAEAEKSSRSEVGNAPASQATEKPSRVEFGEPEAEVINERPLQEDHKKMKKKKDKVKPILLNKDEHTPILATPPPIPANHFEEILPKDDLLLKRKESKEDLNVKTSEEIPEVKETVASVGDGKKSGGSKGTGGKADKQTSGKSEKQGAQKLPEKNPSSAKVDKVAAAASHATTKSEKQEPLSTEKSAATAEKISPPQKPEKSVPAPKVEKVVEHGTPPAISKERSKKKKNTDLATLQQMSGDREGVNVSLLVPLVRKAELSRSEIQILIDLLLNKQQEGPAVLDSEWIEGRQDPVAKLKKQLADKEKALAEEQEASQAVQSKLRELRAELNSERSRLLQACRQLEESLAGRQAEVQALAARLQHAAESHGADKQALAQVQAKHAEEQAMLRKLQQELDQSQAAFQQELVGQRQQLELHIAGLGEQMAQMEGAYKAQVEQLHLQLQELGSQNSSLSAELGQRQRELDDLGDKLVHMQKAATQHLAVQLEESRKALADAEDRLAYSRRGELDQQQMCEDLREQLEATAARNAELEGEAGRLSAQVAAFHRVQDENKQLAEQVASLSQLQLEVQQLREENESLATQMTAVTERPAAEGRENGDLHYAEEKGEDESAKQTEALLEEATAELKQKSAALERLSEEVFSCKTEMSRLSEELDGQREKNNALRTKNWKVMEALSAAEKTAESKAKQCEKLVSESIEKTKINCESSTKELLLRIFPEISVKVQDYHEWLAQFEQRANSLLSELRSRPQHNSSAMLLDAERNNTELQDAVANYKTIIKTMEGELEKTKDRLQQEVDSCRKRLQDKELEVVQLRQENERLQQLSVDDQQADTDGVGVQFALSCIGKSLPLITTEMQAKLLEIQKKLDTVSSEKLEVTQKYEALQKSSYELQTELMRCRDTISSLQQIKEELETQLSGLQKQQAKACSGESRLMGDDEDDVSQQQMDKFNGVDDAHHSVAANGASSEPSTPEGGSGKK